MFLRDAVRRVISRDRCVSFYNHFRQLPDQHWPPTHLQFNEILSRTCDILGTDFLHR